jgi:acyl-CoA synthetase (AMP-forming)/AMP-acid ligase II
MLYERWRRIARDYQGEIALRDLHRGESWTFGQLAKLTEKAEAPSKPVAHPTGICAEYVFDVLRAWRSGQVVCPLEPGQTAPSITSIPPGVVHLKLTSATTGMRKLVAFTAAALMADAENIVQTMELRPEWPNFGAISLAHSYGFSNLITPLLLHGIPLILSGSTLPESLRQAAKLGGEGLTLAAVPALWRIWHETHVITPHIRLGISAGAPLPLKLEEAVFSKAGLKIHNFYGATECGGIAFDRSATPRTDPSCVGRVMQNVEVKTGIRGRLEVRSAAVAEGYWPKRSRDLGDGLFRSTDVAQIDDGEIYLRGRLTDQINVAGRKVFPETIERVLLTHPAVRECSVFGLASAELERVENVVACVATRSKLDLRTLQKFAISHLPAWQVPRQWWFVREIKSNLRGKVTRSALREKYLRMKRAARGKD